MMPTQAQIKARLASNLEQIQKDRDAIDLRNQLGNFDGERAYFRKYGWAPPSVESAQQRIEQNEKENKILKQHLE